jgi:hypothetical protein
MADNPKTAGDIFAASLPAAIAAGLVAIGALLVSMQVQAARIEATVQATAAAIQELKNDARGQLADLDKRVRTLEMQD